MRMRSPRGIGPGLSATSIKWTMRQHTAITLQCSPQGRALVLGIIELLANMDFGEDEQAEKLKELIPKELSLTGETLEQTILDILWRFREPESQSLSPPLVRPYNIIRRLF